VEDDPGISVHLHKVDFAQNRYPVPGDHGGRGNTPRDDDAEYNPEGQEDTGEQRVHGVT
jgi:hypothetical protein